MNLTEFWRWLWTGHRPDPAPIRFICVLCARGKHVHDLNSGACITRSLRVRGGHVTQSPDRVDRLIAAAAACVKCGKEHVLRERQRCTCTPDCIHMPGRTWADPDDGHSYSHPAISVWWLRRWAEANPS